MGGAIRSAKAGLSTLERMVVVWGEKETNERWHFEVFVNLQLVVLVCVTDLDSV